MLQLIGDLIGINKRRKKLLHGRLSDGILFKKALWWVNSVGSSVVFVYGSGEQEQRNSLFCPLYFLLSSESQDSQMSLGTEWLMACPLRSGMGSAVAKVGKNRLWLIQPLPVTCDLHGSSNGSYCGNR